MILTEGLSHMVLIVLRSLLPLLCCWILFTSAIFLCSWNILICSIPSCRLLIEIWFKLNSDLVKLCFEVLLSSSVFQKSIEQIWYWLSFKCLADCCKWSYFFGLCLFEGFGIPNCCYSWFSCSGILFLHELVMVKYMCPGICPSF